jgi:uncharacterized protein (TIGR00106 family)
MAIVEISIVPIGLPGTSLSAYGAQAAPVLRHSRLKYELTAMGTIISGALEERWRACSPRSRSMTAGTKWVIRRPKWRR